MKKQKIEDKKKSSKIITSIDFLKLYLSKDDFMALAIHKKALVFSFDINGAGEVGLSGWAYEKYALAPVKLTKKPGILFPYKQDTNLGNIVLSKDDVKDLRTGWDASNLFLIFLPFYKSLDNIIYFKVFPSSTIDKDTTTPLIEFEVNPSPPKNFNVG